MKNIGIATTHSFHNSGAVLQALALQKAIIKIGHRPEVINFHMEHRGPGIYDLYPNMSCIKIDGNVKDIVTTRMKKFEDFIKSNLSLSKEKFCSINDLIKSDLSYDIFMSGGDIIWYPNVFCHEWELFYFLQFTKSENKISYGTGLHCAMNDVSLPFEYLRRIDSFKAVSIREIHAAWSLRFYTDKKIDWVLDSSLLNEAYDYDPYAINPGYKNNEYIFAYFTEIRDREALTDYLTKLSIKYSLPVVLNYNLYPINTDHITTFAGVGPGEWLWLLSHSKLIVTASFHAVCFGILNNIPLLVNRKDDRINTVLEKLELTDFYVDNYDDGAARDVDFSYDFSKANAILEKERERSLGILARDIELCN